MYEIRKIKKVIATIILVFMFATTIFPLLNIRLRKQNINEEVIVICNENLFKIKITKQEKNEEEINNTDIDTSGMIEIENEEYVDMNVPDDKLFKSYMGEQFIKSKSSNQYILKEKYELDESTGIYTVDNRYCCALGSYYTTTIGQKFDVFMKSGEIICCILADCKNDFHTDSLKQYTIANGSVVEFVVNEEVIIPKISINGNNTGDISTLGGIFEGEIDYIRIYH